MWLSSVIRHPIDGPRVESTPIPKRALDFVVVCCCQQAILPSGHKFDKGINNKEATETYPNERIHGRSVEGVSITKRLLISIGLMFLLNVSTNWP